MTTTAYHVSGPETRKPLIDFLASRMSISRKRAKQLLDDRSVFVNRQRVWMARHPLQRGDIVEVQARLAPAREVPKLRILYRDESYLVIDKPAGMLSNGPRSAETRLREELERPDLEAVHRLDRDTTGCLLFAFGPAARDAAVALFEEHRIRKTYRALVFGSFPPDLRSIRAPIDGKPAETKIRVVALRKDASHLELTIETGRTHQIRKHLAGRRHPLLGDKVYVTEAVESERLRAAPRQMLHALGLEFPHPFKNCPVQLKSPLPPDFTAMAVRLNLLPAKT